MNAMMQDSWSVIETGSLTDEAALVRRLIAETGLDAAARARIGWSLSATAR